MELRRVIIETFHIDQVPEIPVNDRVLQWLVAGKGQVQSELCSCCVVQFKEGASAKPPHAHPDCEEAIYILSGSGEIVLEKGKSRTVKEGSFLLLRKNEIHLLKNTGQGIMKAICFFSSPTDNSKYDFFPMESVENV
jgi:quercetin dioxygenase-like cupin family protein